MSVVTAYKCDECGTVEYEPRTFSDYQEGCWLRDEEWDYCPTCAEVGWCERCAEYHVYGCPVVEDHCQFCGEFESECSCEKAPTDG